LRRQDDSEGLEPGGEAQQVSPAWTLAPSLATCEHGHLVASRTGSGARPPREQEAGGSRRGAKRETARIAVDRSPDRPLADPSRYIGRNLHSRRSTRSPHQRQHRIMDGGHSIRDCASCPSTGLHSTEYRDPPGGAPPAGRAGPPRLLAQPRAAARLGYHRLGNERLRPHCDHVFEVRNLRRLVACVDETTTS